MGRRQRCTMDEHGIHRVQNHSRQYVAKLAGGDVCFQCLAAVVYEESIVVAKKLVLLE